MPSVSCPTCEEPFWYPTGLDLKIVCCGNILYHPQTGEMCRKKVYCPACGAFRSEMFPQDIETWNNNGWVLSCTCDFAWVPSLEPPKPEYDFARRFQSVVDRQRP